MCLQERAREVVQAASQLMPHSGHHMIIFILIMGQFIFGEFSSGM